MSIDDQDNTRPIRTPMIGTWVPTPSAPTRQSGGKEHGRLHSPTHFGRRLPGHAAYVALEVPLSRPTTDKASLTFSLALIGLLTPAPPRDLASPPEVTRCSSVPCRPQTPAKFTLPVESPLRQHVPGFRFLSCTSTSDWRPVTGDGAQASTILSSYPIHTSHRRSHPGS
jgi:hypothetical protein